jgi:D-cysteine desulfhydrase
MTIEHEIVAEPELFRHWPQLRGRVPHIPLGTFPTPVDTVTLPDGREVQIKRDDQSAQTYAGNKLRKLEFLLADARARGAKRLITAGATGSHHAFATAYHGRDQGFDVTLVLFPQTRTPHVREMLLLDAAVGAELRWASRMEMIPFGVWRARAAHRGEAPQIIAPGGSSAIGTLGYVSAALELARQIERGEATAPTSVHVAMGTMGTAAGLALGFACLGLQIPVVATRITARIVTNERMLASLMRATVTLLRGAGVDVPDAESAMRLITIRHDQLGAGYGHSTEAGDAATHLFRACDIGLDATYTAKAAAALLSVTTDDERPLFWHTLSAALPRHLLRDVSEAMLPAQFAAYLAR